VSVAVYQSRHGALLISTQHRHLFALVSQRTLEGEPLLGHMPWGVAERWLGMRGGRTGFSQVRGMAHSPQNSVPVGFSDSSRGQRMGAPSDTAARVVGAYGQKPRRPSRIDMGWMVCQYSRAGLVSSEKHEVTPGTEVEGRGGHTAMVGTGTMVMGSYSTRPKRLAVNSRTAKLTKSLKFMTLWRLYSYDTLLERLAQDLQDVAVELRQFIQQEHPVVRPRYVAGPRHLPPTDQPHIGDRVVGGAKRPRREARGAVTGAAGDAVDAGGVKGFRSPCAS
jgi:hypothetical protein